MGQIHVKICAIQDMSDALSAADAGADALGFLVETTHKAEDAITEEDAAYIVSGLKKSGSAIECVLTTHLIEPKKILDTASKIGADTIQIHGDATPEDVTLVKSSFSGRVVKTIHVGDLDHTLAKARMYTGTCDAILLDSKTAERIGGTGIVCDWNVAAKIVEAMHEVKTPVYLAGGICPENVRDAIKIVRPDGVDMNSGVEYDNGRKSFDKIYAVVQAANDVG